MESERLGKRTLTTIIAWSDQAGKIPDPLPQPPEQYTEFATPSSGK